jgi:putative transcriptional regulator
VYLGVDRQLLERIITHPEPTETFRAYAGYAGWAPGQLEFEMGMGSWLVAPADSASLFDKAPESLWEELVEKIRAPRVIRDGEGLPARDDQTGSAAGL